MKSTLVILLFILSPLFAQSELSEDKINVKEIVEKQISEAKKKLQNDDLSFAEIAAINENNKTERYNSGFDINSIETRLSILAGFSIFVFSFVAVKRYKKSDKKETDKLKKNIQLMRQEKFIRPIDPKLKKLRTNLFLNSRYLNEDHESVSSTARRYNIAKTELILASRFRKETLRVN